MDIFVNVANQKLRISTYDRNLVDGTQKFVRFIFDLSDDWDGLLTFAQFRQGENAYNQYLDENNCVYLPTEIKAGTCTLMLYGSSNPIIGTTNYLTLTIDENILVANADSTEISVSLYDQLVSQVSSLNEKVTQLQNNRVTLELIEGTVAAEMTKYLESGALANITIKDGSITRNKVDAAFEEVLQKADFAMQPSVYDTQNRNTDIFAYVDKSIADVSSTGNWDQNNENGNGFIHNRPLYLESGTASITWDGQPTEFSTGDGYRISGLTPDGDDLAGGTATISMNGTKQIWPISAYYKNQSLLTAALKNITDTSTILVVDGNIMGYGTGFLGLLAGDGTLIGMVIPEGFDASLPAGIYAVIIDDKSEGNVANRYYIAGLDYEYANVIVDKRYSSVLKKNGEANVFVVDAGSADVTTVDFSAYQAGDVVLVIGADELAEVSV